MWADVESVRNFVAAYVGLAFLIATLFFLFVWPIVVVLWALFARDRGRHSESGDYYGQDSGPD